MSQQIRATTDTPIYDALVLELGDPHTSGRKDPSRQHPISVPLPGYLLRNPAPVKKKANTPE